MPRYRALVGIDFGTTRLEPGDESDEIPGMSVPWLLEDGHIERVETPTKPGRRPQATSPEEV